MPWFTSASTLKIIDSVAIVIAQAYHGSAHAKWSQFE